jgi:site-specific recombinase XerD
MKPMDFPAAIKSFVGYLEGTEKSLHTIKNYKLDLQAFQNFLREKYSTPKALTQIDAVDLEHYQDHLKSLGLKTNTRRRKLMTLRKFLSFLAGRKKLSIDLGRGLLTPHKLEKIPTTVPAAELLQAIDKLPRGTEIEMRNRALLWTLLETGCLISEAAKIRYNDWSAGGASSSGQAWLEFHGKSPRKVAISSELFSVIKELEKNRKGDSPWVFHGFNKFGALGAAISPRGIEILVKSYADKLGFPDIVPRTFRHSIVLEWLNKGFTEESIQQRLGLKSAYAFRAFRAIEANAKTKN